MQAYGAGNHVNINDLAIGNTMVFLPDIRLELPPHASCPAFLLQIPMCTKRSKLCLLDFSDDDFEIQTV
jgi:hypothetical protein